MRWPAQTLRYIITVPRDTAPQASAPYAAADQDDCDMIETTPQRTFPAPRAQYTRCVAYALSRAPSIREPRAALDRVRQAVFEEIAGSHPSIGAYEILDRLAEKGTRLAPISVYRAIDALDSTLASMHRLESKNALFACHRLDRTGDAHRSSCPASDATWWQEVTGQGIFEAIDRAAARC